MAWKMVYTRCRDGAIFYCSYPSSLYVGAVEPFMTSATMWIAVSITVVVVFIAAVLVSVLLFYRITKCRSKNSKPKPCSHQPQQAGPEYEEVAEIGGSKVAYRPTQRIEMRTNEAYSPTQHWSWLGTTVIKLLLTVQVANVFYFSTIYTTYT